MKGGSGAAPLDAEHAAFVQGGVSVIVATRDAARLADAVRGCGCRVSRDRRRVTVLVDGARSPALLDNIAANGEIAVVFSQPSTHRTIQLKGSDAELVRALPADRRRIAEHRAAWVAELVALGYARPFVEALWGQWPVTLAAVVFTPTAAYQQTPGPAAGQPLRGTP